MSASISGLSSGMDTATIISQLMQLEAVQQNRLKTRVTATTTAKTTLQSLNTKLAALATAAKDLARSSGWSPMSTTSSYDKVSVSTTIGAQPTQLSLTVGSTAVSHLLTFATTAATSVLQRVAGRIGVSVSKRAVGKGVSRWLPVVGALGVGAYAYYDTGQVAKTAIDLFSGDVHIDDGDTPATGRSRAATKAPHGHAAATESASAPKAKATAKARKAVKKTVAKKTPAKKSSTRKKAPKAAAPAAAKRTATRRKAG